MLLLSTTWILLHSSVRSFRNTHDVITCDHALLGGLVVSQVPLTGGLDGWLRDIGALRSKRFFSLISRSWNSR